uniref:Immune mapped protein 2 N-terminal domain-containing protein n=1 Tax=Babesia bovis TaxID=5865 RepID=S6AZI8_BABBO|nr:hypothetical protein [Babesia bovis]
MDATEVDNMSAGAQSGVEGDSATEQCVNSGRSQESDSMMQSTTVPSSSGVQRQDSSAGNFSALTSSTPVCYCVYEEVAQGTFYMQWKASTSEPINNHIMMFVPSKAVPKFKLVNDGGRSELSTRVMVGALTPFCYHVITA